MKIFIENKKGYIDIYDNIKHFKIKKIDNKNNLIIKDYDNFTAIISLNEITLFYIIDSETLTELFRYEK